MATTSPYSSSLPRQNRMPGTLDLFGKYLQKKAAKTTQTPSTAQEGWDKFLLNIKNLSNNLHLLKITAEQESPSRLWYFVRLSKTDSRIQYLASNAISALKMIVSLSDEDLSGARLPGANLSEGCFRSVNFSGANLEGANCQLGYFENGVFAGANLKGVDFGQYKLSSPEACHPDAFCVTAQGNLVAIGEKWDEHMRDRPRLFIWAIDNPSNARLISTCEQDPGFVSVAFTADCSALISAGGDGRIKIWNPSTGALVETFAPNYVLKSDIEAQFSKKLLDELEQKKCIKAVLHYPAYVEVSLERKTFEEAQISNLKEILSFFGDKIGISSCAISSSIEKPLLACIKNNGDIFIWDLKSRSLIHLISGQSACRNVIFLPNGYQLLFVTEKSINLLDIRTQAVSQQWTSPMPAYFQMGFSTEANLIAACGLEGVVVWSLDHPEPLKIIRHDFRNKPRNEYETASPLPDMAEKFAISNSGKYLAIGVQKEIQIWNTTDWKLTASFGGPELRFGVTGLQFLHNDEYLLSIFGNEDPKIWKIPAPSPTSHELHYSHIDSVEPSSNGRFLASFSGKTLRIWDAQTGDFLWKLEENIDGFSLSHDSPLLLVYSEKKARVWDLQTHARVVGFSTQSEIKGCSFLADGRLALLEKEMVTIFNLNTKKSTAVLQNKVNSLSTFNFSDDGRWFAFGAEEGVLKAWDSTTGNLYTLRKAFNTPIEKINFCGNTIIARSNSHLLIWMPLENKKHVLDECKDAYVIPGRPDLFLLGQAGQFGVYHNENANFKLTHWLHANAQAPLQKFLHQLDPDIESFHDDFGRLKQWSRDREIIYTADHRLAFSVSYLRAQRPLAFHPSYPLLVLGGDNGMMQLWNPISGRLINVLWGQTAAIQYISFSRDGSLMFVASDDRTMQCWKLANQGEQARLQWRSHPHSLNLHGINTHHAQMDPGLEKVLFSEGVKTDQGLAMEFLLRNQAPYIYKPYLFPPDEAEYYTHIELKTANMDIAILLLQHQIINEADDKKFLETLVSRFPDLRELIPSSFHFILTALHSVARATQDKTPVDRTSLCLLYQILEEDTSQEHYVNIRQFMDRQLQKVIRRLSQMLFLVELKDKSHVYEEVGDIFTREQNSVQAIICYTEALKDNPRHAELYFKRGLAWLKRNKKDEALKDLVRAKILAPQHPQINHHLSQLTNNSRDS